MEVFKPVLECFAQIHTCKFPSTNLYNGIPVIDLLKPESKSEMVKACQEFGFFKVINHGVPLEVIAKLEAEAVQFFGLPQAEKEKAGPANPLGYRTRGIGPSSDMGWIEYLLFTTNPEGVHQNPVTMPGNSKLFWSCVNDYVSAVTNMACEVLEMIADGLEIAPRNVLSKLLRDENSDTLFRLNHYPPCADLQELGDLNFVGFIEHTDPQIITVLRSNNASGLQICLKDGTWVSVSPDEYSFYVNVGDSLQVMTNGRFKSVKHRVLADGLKSRLSMIYLGGPPLDTKIAPLSSLMEEGEESLYKLFTWREYKSLAFLTPLGDNRLALFRKSAGH